MIASVSLRPCGDGDGFEADLHLDPVVVRGSLEQQGYPRTPDDLARVERRRLEAIEQCVQRVNAGLSDTDRIRSVTVVGQSDGRWPESMCAT